MATRMSATAARNRFSDVVNRAFYTGEPAIVERQGKPMTELISPEQYEQFQEQQKPELFKTIQSIQARNKNADPAEVYRDVTEVVEEVRQEAYDKGAKATS